MSETEKKWAVPPSTKEVVTSRGPKTLARKGFEAIGRIRVVVEGGRVVVKRILK